MATTFPIDDDVAAFAPQEICARIERLTSRMMSFWKDPGSWPGKEAEALLNASMLEWQVSLAARLGSWLSASSSGELILAWANLGALVEGQLKLFLCAFYADYKQDVDGIFIKKAKKDPDTCMLAELRAYFERQVWKSHTLTYAEADWSAWVDRVRVRRNAIHAFQPSPIGTVAEWTQDLRHHLTFVRWTNWRLIYPDEIATPTDEP